MREGWKEVTIGDLGKVVTGNTPPRKNPELYGSHTLFVKPTDISVDSKYTYSPEECYSDLGYKKYIKSLIPKGSTCIVTIGSIGKKMTKAHCDLFINQAVNAVIPNEKYDDEFVYYVLKYNLSQLKTFDSGTASGRENVSKTSFSNIKINVPIDKNIQESIGKLLSAYDDLIENNQRRIKILEEMAQQTYEEWFVRMRFPGHESAAINTEAGLPEGWEKGKLNNITDYLSGYAFKSSEFKNKGNGIIRIKNIGNNTIDISDVVYIDDDYAKKQNKFLLKAGDLLIAMTGATVGKVGIMPFSDKKFYLNQRVGKLITENTAFLNSFFNSTYGINQIVNIASGAAQPNISAQQILDIELVVPKQSVLQLFAQNFNKNISIVVNLQSQNQRLREARDILLPRLMMGVITV